MSTALLKLSPEARERVRRVLERGEIVQWAEQPRWTSVLPGALAIGGFALCWTWFCVTWEAAALHFLWDATLGPNRSRTPVAVAAIMSIFGLPFVLIGLGMLCQPVSMIRRARSTIYAITDRRIIELSNAPVTVQSTLPGSIRAFRKQSWGSAIDRRLGRTVRILHHGVRKDSDGDLVEIATTLYGLSEPERAEAALMRLTRLSPSPDEAAAPA